MPYEFKFPDVGEGITEGELVHWLVKEGSLVRQDQPIAEIETDKAIVQIPSPVVGKILKLHFNEKDTIKVGDVFVTIEPQGAVETQPDAVKVVSPDQAVPLIVQTPQPEKQPEKKESFGVVGELEEAPEERKPQEEHLVKPLEDVRPKDEQRVRVLATPAARKLAKELNVDLSKVQGTGPLCSVRGLDVMRYNKLRQDAAMQQEAKQAHVEKPAPESATAVNVQSVRKYDEYGHVEHVPFHSIRKATARRMVAAWTRIPHVTHTDEVDVTALVRVREKEKVSAEKKGIKLTYLPFVIKSVVAAMKESHPYLNASLDEDHSDIVLKKYYNIGFAVDTEEGLMVPVLKGTDEKSILDIAKELQTLADSARKRTIDLGDLKGGTFTITNIGGIGGIFATPIINQAESAILALGRICEKPVFVKNKLRKRWFLPMSLTFDHRILDGAEAARFINTVKEHLEDPSLLLVERD